jgi:hypothetical protein
VRFGAEAEINDAHGVTGRDQWWRKQQRETNDNDTTPVTSTKNGCALRSVQEDSHSFTTLASWRKANFNHTVLQKKKKKKKKTQGVVQLHEIISSTPQLQTSNPPSLPLDESSVATLSSKPSWKPTSNAVA